MTKKNKNIISSIEQENESYLLIKDKREYNRISQFVKNFFEEAVGKNSTVNAAKMFAENAFINNYDTDVLVATKLTIDSFLESTFHTASGLNLTFTVNNLIAKKITFGLYEAAMNLQIRNSRSMEVLSEYNMIFTLIEDKNDLKICSLFTTLNNKNDNFEENHIKITSVASLFKFISDAIPIGLVKIKKNQLLRIEYSNAHFNRLIGYSKEEYAKKFDDAFLGCIEENILQETSYKLIEAIKHNENIRIKTKIKTASNQIRDIEIISFATKAEKNRSVFLTMRDITNEIEMKKSIEFAKNIFTNGSSSRQAIKFEYYPKQDVILFSEKSANDLGLETKIRSATSSLIATKFVNPVYKQSYANLVSNIQLGKNNDSALLSLRLRPEKYTFCLMSINKIFDNNDSKFHYYGSIMELVAQNEIATLVQKEAINRQLTLNAHEKLIMFDVQNGKVLSLLTKNSNIIDITKTSETNFFNYVKDISSNNIIKSDVSKFVDTFTSNNLIRMFNNKQYDFHIEHKQKIENVVITMDLICHLSKSSKSNKIIAFCFLKNIEKEKRAEKVYNYELQHDELTQFLTRKFAIKSMENFIEKSPQSECHAFIIVEITNLQLINAESGRIFTDQLIVNLTKNIKNIFGEKATYARFSGNQFVVLLKSIPTKEYAVTRANQLLSLYIDSISPKSKFNIAIGLSYFPFEGLKFIDIYGCADSALVEAKKMTDETSNLLLFEDITEAKIEKDANFQANHLGTGTQSSESGDDRTTYSYFIRTNMRYWAKTGAITIAALIILVVLEVVFSKELRVITSGHNVAFWTILLATATIIIGIALTYHSSHTRIRKLLYVDNVTMGHTKLLFDNIATDLLKKRKGKFAYISVNIKKFKVLNERFGNKSGDQILKNLYKVITSALDDDEICARSNSDKFVILCKYLHSTSEVIDKIQRISRLASRISDESHIAYGVKCKFGIYFIEDKKENLIQYYNRSELALALADEDPLNNYYVFDSTLKSKMYREKEIESMMQDALFNNHFRVYLQPKVSLSQSSVVGAEALVRWIEHGKMIVPSEFIHIFEKNGFITQLDMYMFGEVCRLLRKWQDEGKRLVTISINITQKSIVMPNFVTIYKRIMDRYKIDKKYIQFEITESMMVEDFDNLSMIIRKIHEMGCTCSIDDFGTGFSSLSVLKNANVDSLKIDRSFFLVGEDQRERQRASAVIKGIIFMAKSLNMEIVAEGVEDKALISYLKKLDCDMIQSFAYYKPLSVIDFEKLIS